MKSKVTITLLMVLLVLMLGHAAKADTVPQGFPFAACPGGTVIESGSTPQTQIVEYKTPQSAREISEFYTQDLKSKGWTLTSGGMQTSDYSVLRATKGKDRVTMSISFDGRLKLVRARLVVLINPNF